jgi:hypothetical protein
LTARSRRGVAAAQHRAHAAAGDLAGELVALAASIGGRHGVGLWLDDVGALARHFLQQYRLQVPQARPRGTERRGQPAIERIGWD